MGLLSEMKIELDRRSKGTLNRDQVYSEYGGDRLTEGGFIRGLTVHFLWA